MGYYITKDGFKPSELLGDYCFGNPNRSPLLTPLDEDSPIHLSNKLYKFYYSLFDNKELRDKLNKIDPDFYSIARVNFYEPHNIYNNVYAERNEYSDFVSMSNLTKYNGVPAFQDEDKGFLVLSENDIQDLNEWEKILKEEYEYRYKDWIVEVMENLEYDEDEEEVDEEDIDDSELREEVEKEMISSHFDAGSIWVDFKKGTLERLQSEFERIKSDLESIGHSDSNLI